MEIREIIGIDISKKTFDAKIEFKNVYAAFDNTENGFKRYKKWLQKNLGKDLSDVRTVMEHTGIYSYQLEQYLHQQGLPFSKAGGLEIKRSSGLVRGKNDKLDAQRIAEYGAMKKDKLKVCPQQDKAMLRLKNLISLRDKLVRDKAGYQGRMKEQLACLDLLSTDLLITIQKNIIHSFERQIQKLEVEIKELVQQNTTTQKNYDLLTSIKGVGPVLATYVIAYTGNFTHFEDARQFACYVGVAPFPHDSGTSIKSKAKVSPLGFKKIKTILHMAATSAVQSNAELKLYYERRLEKGKSKMSTLNVVRNKLLYRMFAVVRKQTAYTKLLPTSIN